jgi:hypothetical protein
MNTHNGLSLQQLDVKHGTEQFTPFVRHLLKMEPRIRLSMFFGDVKNMTGFFLTKEHIYFPCRIQPVSHELAHCVEMQDKRRWTMDDWGFALPPHMRKGAPKKYNDARWQSKGGLFAAVSREQRVLAINSVISPLAKDHHDYYGTKITTQLSWNGFHSDWYLPFGRFKTMKDVEVWLNDLFEKTVSHWSLDRIEAEWKVRLDHMQNWMETKE